jgi:hypothetical protein
MSAAPSAARRPAGPAVAMLAPGGLSPEVRRRFLAINRLLFEQSTPGRLAPHSPGPLSKFAPGDHEQIEHMPTVNQNLIATAEAP